MDPTSTNVIFQNVNNLTPFHAEEEASDPHFPAWAGVDDVKREPGDKLQINHVSNPMLPVKAKSKRVTRPITIAKCEICGIVLRHPSKINAHMRTHTGEKPFECDICHQKFSQRTPMVNHFREHMQDLPFTCSFGCGKRFVNNARKNAHELRHLGMNRSGPARPHLKPPRRLICPPLMTAVSRSEHLSNSAIANYIPSQNLDELHIIEAPSDIPSTSDRTAAEIEEEEEMMANNETKKLIEALNELSNKPENETTNRVQLSQDEIQKRIDDVIETVLQKCLAPRVEEDPITELVEEKHEPMPKKRQYTTKRATTMAQCTVCGLMLKHPSKIAEHVRTHTGEKPFQCGECGLCVSKATSLKIHIRRMHTNHRPHTCEWECGMSFVSKGCKKEHEKVVHAGLKRYECLIGDCVQSFSRRSYLMRHRKTIHGDVFTPIFDDVQVTNEEEAEEGIGESNDDHIILYDNVLMMNHSNRPIVEETFDEQEFVEEVLRTVK